MPLFRFNHEHLAPSHFYLKNVSSAGADNPAHQIRSTTESVTSSMRQSTMLPRIFPCLMAILLLSATACQKSNSTISAETSETLVQAKRLPVSKESTTQVDLNAPLADGQDWPRFLGLHQNGVSDETGLLDSWPEDGPPLVWELDVGAGYSAPSVKGHRLVLHHRLEDREIVDCMHAESGQPLWRYDYPSHFRDPYGYNNGPRCTPLLTETHCFTLGAEGKLLCLELESGKLVWQHDLRSEYEIPEGFFGIGATPLLEGEKLIVAVGGQPNSALVAFSAKSGEQLWASVGKSTWDGAETGWPADPKYSWTGEEMLVSYSSPMAVTIHDKRHILCLLRQGLVSVDPETGEENFHYWFMSRTHDSVNAAMPVVVKDTILLGAAYRVGSVRLQVEPDGRSVKTLWRDRRTLSTHWSTAIFQDGCYFGFSGRHENEAQLQCVDAKTGDVRWQTPGWERMQDLKQTPEGAIVDRKTGSVIPWPFYGRGSAILADNKLVVLGERGTLALLKVDTEHWQEISRCAAPKMKYPSWTAPILSRGKLYLRCEDALVCLNISRENN